MCYITNPRFEDGAPVKFGDWFTDSLGNIDCVESISFEPNYFLLDGINGSSYYEMNKLVRRPVINGNDNKVICIGETVYGQDGKAWEVTDFNCNSRHSVKGKNGDSIRDLKPEWLSHEKPITPEDIEAYIESHAIDYLLSCGNGMYDKTKMVRIDVVENAMSMLNEFYKKNKDNASFWH